MTFPVLQGFQPMAFSKTIWQKCGYLHVFLPNQKSRVAKYSHFRPIEGYISETVQYRK